MSGSSNPLRSEAAMFRVLVIVALAALPIILAGALFGPVAGLLVLLVESGVAIGYAWQRRSGAARRSGGGQQR